ncbi:hypothetical protein DPMN_184535 [Dreissena polymorpha]|uniref:Uncharacterized protein n=1 Tax=Dreissena polymorpha TaxID=45954 RepID=A0A9D4DM02_DREPO|nr:hypothetical protein DPMN_184535 [Dreissena polymorpha]
MKELLTNHHREERGKWCGRARVGMDRQILFIDDRNVAQSFDWNQQAASTSEVRRVVVLESEWTDRYCS